MNGRKKQKEIKRHEERIKKEESNGKKKVKRKAVRLIEEVNEVRGLGG
jgi:hypothetical protein